MKHAQDNGGRLLRTSEVETLIQQEDGPLSPIQELWVACAFGKWIQIGPYAATFRFRTGATVSKKN